MAARKPPAGPRGPAPRGQPTPQGRLPFLDLRPGTPAALPAPSAAERVREGTERVALALEGMHCASCVRTIENALAAVPGVDGGVGQPRHRAGPRPRPRPGTGAADRGGARERLRGGAAPRRGADALGAGGGRPPPDPRDAPAHAGRRGADRAGRRRLDGRRDVPRAQPRAARPDAAGLPLGGLAVSEGRAPDAAPPDREHGHPDRDGHDRGAAALGRRDVLPRDGRRGLAPKRRHGPGVLRGRRRHPDADPPRPLPRDACARAHVGRDPPPPRARAEDARGSSPHDGAGEIEVPLADVARRSAAPRQARRRGSRGRHGASPAVPRSTSRWSPASRSPSRRPPATRSSPARSTATAPSRWRPPRSAGGRRWPRSCAWSSRRRPRSRRSRSSRTRSRASSCRSSSGSRS